MANVTRKAEDAGLSRSNVPECWECPFCERIVAEGQLEAHLGSKDHRKRLEQQLYSAQLAERSSRGELPDYIVVRDGAEYCMLCEAYAQESHMISQKHLRKVQLHEERRSRQGAGARAAGAGAGALGGAARSACDPAARSSKHQN